MDALWQRLDLWLRAAMPSVLAFLMALLGVAVWPVPHLGPIMPPLAFMALYYWAAHRPDLFPASMAFLLGLLNDVLLDLPLGVSAGLFTLAHQVIWRQRRFFSGHSFSMLWFGFGLASSFLMLAQWAVVSVISWQWVPIMPIVIQTIFGIALFPLPCWAMIRLQRALLSAG